MSRVLDPMTISRRNLLRASAALGAAAAPLGLISHDAQGAQLIARPPKGF